MDEITQPEYEYEEEQYDYEEHPQDDVENQLNKVFDTDSDGDSDDVPQLESNLPYDEVAEAEYDSDGYINNYAARQDMSQYAF